MKRRFIFICLLLIAGFSCQETGYPKPKELVSEKQMADILYDIHLNEAYVNSYRGGDTLDFDSEDLHFSVLEKYGITDSIFYQSIIYYSSLPKTYERIYQQVVDRLVMLEQELDKKEAVKVKQ